MIKKSLTILAGGLLIANVSNATEIFNQDGTTFSVGGYLKLGYETTAKHPSGKLHTVDGKYNSSRINFSGTHQINDNVSVFGLTEWGFDPNEAGDNDFLTSRLAYIGIEHDMLGKVSFGKQDSVYKNVTGFTDHYDITGGDALGVNDDGVNGSFNGTGRADSALQYSVDLNGTTISLQYQAREDRMLELNSQDTNLKREYSLGASVVTEVMDELKIGVAGNWAKLGHVGEIDSAFNNAKLDRVSAVIGGEFENDLLLIGLNVSYNTNMYNAGLTKSYTIGQESFVGVKMDGAMVYVGNNYATTNYDEKSFKDTTDYNYIALGTMYEFTDRFSASAEYRQDLRSMKDIRESTNGGNVNQIVVSAKYMF